MMKQTRWTHRLAATATAAALTLTLLPVSLADVDDRRRGGWKDRGRIWQNAGSDRDLVEQLGRLGDFSILLTALDTAGLTSTVAEEGPFTIFAPTDDAFAELLAEMEISAADLLASPDLTNILLYHVLAGRRGSLSLLAKSTADTLFEGRDVLVKFESFQAIVNESTVTRANVRASNGVIHVVDKVLLPKEQQNVETVMDVIRFDPRFSILRAALEQEGLDTALDGSDDLTLFAPTNEAFVDLLDALNISAAELLANPELTQILLYHVVPGNQRAFGLLLQRQVETLQGDPVWISFTRGGIEINDAEVINPNIAVDNGVVHTVGGVLLP